MPGSAPSNRPHDGHGEKALLVELGDPDRRRKKLVRWPSAVAPRRPIAGRDWELERSTRVVSDTKPPAPGPVQGASSSCQRHFNGARRSHAESAEEGLSGQFSALSALSA